MTDRAVARLADLSPSAGGWSPAATAPAPVDISGCKAALDDGSLLAALLGATREQSTDEGQVELVERAFALAQIAHKGQIRKSGEPYLIHPLRVAQTIARMRLDTASIVAGLLHDSVEDSELSLFDLTERFGREVANLVDGVTKLGKVPYLSRKEQQAESFRKMLLAMSQDIRVLVVKLADRLDNMRTLHHMPPEKRERIARETMEIYVPLAHRLGIEWIRRELQDLSFRNLEPTSWEEVSATMSQMEPEATEQLESGLLALVEVFGQPSCPVGEPDLGELSWDLGRFGEVVVGATRRWPYQLDRMIAEEGRKLERVSDLLTYQVITRDRSACYVALGLLHGHFKPVPGRFRDYVALPRPNGYRALHTAVIDRRGVRHEIQIRSERMDAVAELGIVAYWDGTADKGRRPAWLGDLVDWQSDVNDPSEFIEAVKADLFADEVYVFTPEGDIHTFPKGASAIDFAFAIHTDVGLHCSGARVNGHVVPLRYRLRQGDTVEIIVNPDNYPRAEWLKMCTTSRARAKIKQHLRQRERDRLRALGRSLLEQEMSSRGLRLDEYEARGQVDLALERLAMGGNSEPDAVYEALGAGTVSAWEVTGVLAPDVKDEAAEDENLFSRMLRKMSGRGAKPSNGTKRANLGRPTAPIMITADKVSASVDRESMIVLAPCCSPVPGDPILGFFRGGKGIVAHVQGCPEALEQVSEQRVHLAWSEDLSLSCPVTLEIRTHNTVGLLAQMSRAFSQHGVNIKQANCRAYDDGERASNTFHASVGDLSQLEGLMREIKQIPGVISVERVFTSGSGVFPL